MRLEFINTGITNPNRINFHHWKSSKLKKKERN